MVKWKSLQWQLSLTSTKKIPHVLAIVDEYEAKSTQAEGEEAFFIKNDLHLAQESIEKLRSEETHLTSEITEVEKLLQIVNPDLQMDRETGTIGPPEEQERKKPTLDAKGVVDSKPDEMSMLPPPDRIVPTTQQISSQQPTPKSSPTSLNRKRASPDQALPLTSMLPPPPKRRDTTPSQDQSQADTALSLIHI